MSQSGPAGLSIEPSRESPHAPEVFVRIADRGPGIRREDLPHLFKPFYRGKDTKTNGVPGSGLGLSVVRHVVEALGGRVSVVSGEGERGSAFTLHLPAARSAVHSAPSTMPLWSTVRRVTSRIVPSRRRSFKSMLRGVSPPKIPHMRSSAAKGA